MIPAVFSSPGAALRCGLWQVLSAAGHRRPLRHRARLGPQVALADAHPQGWWLSSPATSGSVLRPVIRPLLTLYLPLLHPQEHVAAVRAAVFNHSSTLLATGDENGRVTIWSVPAFKPVGAFRTPEVGGGRNSNRSLDLCLSAPFTTAHTTDGARPAVLAL